MIGQDIYNVIERLFPIHRSITGNGVRQTLKMLQEYIPLKIKEVSSGTTAFDWTVPQEWNIKGAYIKDSAGNTIIDFAQNNLHVVAYSTPVNKTVDLNELQLHLHSLPEYPEVIPYITSYYKKDWGFCIAHKKRLNLKEDYYEIVIDSEFTDGSLTYGELIVPGETEQEVFISTYVCHPSMANNELSGPALSTYLAKYILQQSRRYTYRFIFIPETIGAIVYLSRNLDSMKKNIICGFNLSCIGDDGPYSYVSTRSGNTYTDKIVNNIMSNYNNSIKYSFLERGSDERQYNMPGVDLPVCCLSRSKFHEYKEYHTSADNLDFISAKGLGGSYDFIIKCINAIENNYKYSITCLCEPQLGKRNMYPALGTKYPGQNKDKVITTNVLAYADGKNDLVDISNIIGQPLEDIYPIVNKLAEHNLITKVVP